MATKHFCDRCGGEAASLKLIRLQRGSNSTAFTTDAETQRKEFCSPCEELIWKALSRGINGKGARPVPKVKKPRGRRKV